jgi:hypothetical protein
MYRAFRPPAFGVCPRAERIVRGVDDRPDVAFQRGLWRWQPFHQQLNPHPARAIAVIACRRAPVDVSPISECHASSRDRIRLERRIEYERPAQWTSNAGSRIRAKVFGGNPLLSESDKGHRGDKQETDTRAADRWHRSHGSLSVLTSQDKWLCAFDTRTERRSTARVLRSFATFVVNLLTGCVMPRSVMPRSVDAPSSRLVDSG